MYDPGWGASPPPRSPHQTVTLVHMMAAGEKSRVGCRYWSAPRGKFLGILACLVLEAGSAVSNLAAQSRETDLGPRVSFWRQHLTLAVLTGGVFLVQSGLILALVVQSRRRRWAERESRQRREELSHMTRVATMGELTASLAHEINQPLAAILSNAQAAQRLLAMEEKDWEEINEILADIAADDLRAGEVIRRMRTLLRKGESYVTILDVNDLVAEVLGLVRGEMILHNISLSLELSPQPLLAHGDRIQLQQVLLNLVMNALDAMKETYVRGRKLVVCTKAAGPSHEVSVQDSGVGVPTDKLDEIFEPFVTTKPHGLGLGLSICRSIIQAHGGHIGCRNNPNRGATFWFTLPTDEDLKQ